MFDSHRYFKSSRSLNKVNLAIGKEFAKLFDTVIEEALGILLVIL